jgi:hypothetical protein
MYFIKHNTIQKFMNKVNTIYLIIFWLPKIFFMIFSKIVYFNEND